MKRGRVIVLLALVALALGWVAARALSDNLVYYQTPTELVAKRAMLVGEQVRLGGQVAQGSIQEGPNGVTFILTDGTTRVTVTNTGGVPILFREGKGVVVEGALSADGSFHADTLLVQHGDTYRPPEPGDSPPTSYEPGG